MRISAGDVAALPYCCALVDGTGRVVAATPEWRGFGLGALTYRAGAGTLVVVPDGTSPEVDALVVDLVGEVVEAAPALSRPDRLAAEMYAAGLALVAGHPPGPAAGGSTSDAVEYCREGVRRTVPGVALEVVAEAEARVAAPAALGLGLVQLVRNAARHGGAREVVLRVSRGPTFRVEWADPEAAGARVATARRPDQRRRWGMGFTRLLADSLGGVATAPGPVAPGVMGSSIGLGGGPGLAAPVAAVVGGRVERASRAWDEETGAPPGSSLDERMQAAASAAGDHPGEIAYSDIFRARQAPGRTWLAIAPQSSSGRARDVLRGMQHENALLMAPEPHATRIYALATILAAHVSGEPIDAVPLSTWARDFPAACAALGIPVAAVPDDRLRYPDPRVTAFLIASLDGELREHDRPGGLESVLVVSPAPARAGSPLARLLADGGGEVML